MCKVKTSAPASAATHGPLRATAAALPTPTPDASNATRSPDAFLRAFAVAAATRMWSLSRRLRNRFRHVVVRHLFSVLQNFVSCLQQQTLRFDVLRGNENFIRAPKLVTGQEIVDTDAADDGTMNRAALLMVLLLQKRENTVCVVFEGDHFFECHMRENHSAKFFCVASGKKLEVAKAIFEADSLSGRHRGRNLERSAKLLREQVLEGVPANTNVVRLILDGRALDSSAQRSG